MEAKDFGSGDIDWVEIVDITHGGWVEYHLLIHLVKGGSVFPDPPIHFLGQEGAMRAIFHRWGLELAMRSINMKEITRHNRRD